MNLLLRAKLSHIKQSFLTVAQNKLLLAQYVLLLGFLVLPFIWHKYLLEPIVTIRYLSLGIFSLLVTGLLYFSKNRPSFIGNKWLYWFFVTQIAFVIWALFVALFARNYQATLFETTKVLLLCHVMYLVYFFHNNDAYFFNRFALVLCLAASLQSALGIAQFSNPTIFSLPNPGVQVVGVFANRTIYGTYLALTIPFCIYVTLQRAYYKKILGITSLLLLAISLLLTQTRGSLIAAIFSLFVGSQFFLAKFKAYRVKIILISVISISFLSLGVLLLLKTKPALKEQLAAKFNFEQLTGTTDSSFKNSSAVQRKNTWVKTLAMWRDHPITGVGLGNWKTEVPHYGNTDVVWGTNVTTPDRAHNVYLEILAETGMPGFILFACTWLYLLWAALRFLKYKYSDKQALQTIVAIMVITVYTVDGLFTFTNRNIDFHLLFFCAAAFLLSNQAPTTEFRLATKHYFTTTFSIIAFALLGAYGSYRFLHTTYMIEYSMAINKFGTAERLAQNYRPNIFANLTDEGRTIGVFQSVAYARRGHNPEAITACRQTLLENPTNYNAYFNMAHLYMADKQLDSALKYFRICAYYKPSFDRLKYGLAKAHFKTKTYDSTLYYIKMMEFPQQPDVQTLLKDCKAAIRKKTRRKAKS